MKTSYVFLADGFEEIEALATIDILRRAGMEVKSVSITDDYMVTGANGITVQTDLIYGFCTFADAEWLIIPGGMPGAANLHSFTPLNTLLCDHAATGRIAAICAAPAVVLAPLGILKGRRATCYPGFGEMCLAGGATMVDERVVADGNVITANGPSSAFPFALAIIRHTLGDEAADAVGNGTLYYSYNFD